MIRDPHARRRDRLRRFSGATVRLDVVGEQPRTLFGRVVLTGATTTHVEPLGCAVPIVLTLDAIKRVALAHLDHAQRRAVERDQGAGEFPVRSFGFGRRPR